MAAAASAPNSTATLKSSMTHPYLTSKFQARRSLEEWRRCFETGGVAVGLVPLPTGRRGGDEGRGVAVEVLRATRNPQIGVSNGLPHTTYRLPLGTPWRVLE